ncbi:MAG: DoxX family protein [Bacteroidota bacterium]|jgi:hypothetical protein
MFSNTVLSKRRIWSSRILSGIAVLFLLFDSLIKIIKESHAVEGTIQLGYPETAVAGLGIIEIICLALYVNPRTSPFGAILMTGYLGGAVATQVRIGSPLFTHTFFPLYIALFLWGGLYLADERLRNLLRWKKHSN